MINIAPGDLNDSAERVTTVIADDLEIQGTMKFKNSLMIKGILEGEIISEGLLIVGPTAKVAAKITTKNLISHGEIQGDVTASDRVILKSTSTHNGNITTPNIVIESGSIFNGSCIMKMEAPIQIPDTVFTETIVEKETVSEEITEEAEIQKTEEQKIETVWSSEDEDSAPKPPKAELF
jgi:cytoskeletal protein CcmA (bactofilin family)